jgi:quercetin dioxygenase-like cupin family protein
MVKVERWDEARDGELSETALRRKLEALGYSVYLYTYLPGTRFETHRHSVDKIDAVLAGTFRIEMEDQSVLLEAGDLVWVPRDTPHAAEVVSERAVISLDAVRRD